VKISLDNVVANLKDDAAISRDETLPLNELIKKMKMKKINPGKLINILTTE